MTPKMLPIGYLLMSLLATIATASPDQNERGRQIVAMAKAASGGKGWDSLEVMHDTGQTILKSGQVSRYEHWGDLRNLRTRAFSGTGHMVFDGHVAVYCETPGCESPKTLDHAVLMGGAYLNCFGFFFPNRFAASFDYKGTRTEGGVAFDVVEVSPAGLASVEIWISRDSHLILRLLNADGRTDLSDYRKVNGIMIPFVEVIDGVTIKTETVKFEAANAANFSLPTLH
jgi:hypothetical protein